MAENEDIIRKISKCLALSRSSNSHEAALAIERAHALMKKYAITRTDVELAEISGHRAAAGNAQNPPGHVCILAQMVKKAFGCDAVFDPEWVFDRCFNHVEFIGFGPNPEIAAYVFSVLLRQLERGRRAYLKTLSKRMKRSNKSKMAANWAEGWVLAIYRKVREATISESDRDLLDAWKERRFGSLEKSKARRAQKLGIRGARAYFSGADAGGKVQLHKAMNGQDRARIEK